MVRWGGLSNPTWKKFSMKRGGAMRQWFIFGLALGILSLTVSVFAADPESDFLAFCSDRYLKAGVCSLDICQLQCLEGTKGEDCLQVCLPKKCPDIDMRYCPKNFCTVMTDCSNEKTCQYQMPGEPARCGNLAYAGQDVSCCEGMTRRCGVEFFDGTCDMEGKNSMYSLPICIPCGDGICGNFENRCNCPEDCKNPTLDNPLPRTEPAVKKDEGTPQEKRPSAAAQK
jgi:hypothetical protein